MHSNRREFLESTTLLGSGLALGLAGLGGCEKEKPKPPLFEISLAEWSLHRMLRADKLSNMEFPEFTKREFGIHAVEYVNAFFKDKAEDQKYLDELKKRTDDLGVRNVLIMCDGEGQLGNPDESERNKAVENHHKWVEAAKFLGCHSIRVNAASSGSFEEQQKLAADGLRSLAEFAAPHNINVIVENHGGYSSHGAWLVGVIEQVDLPNCGTLPDFGNFKIGNKEDGSEDWYDIYQGVTELIPFAKAVSAKSHAFDEKGNESAKDYHRIMKIVLEAGYRGYVGIEWEGSEPDEVEGIKLTQQLLERIRGDLSSQFS